MPNLLDENQRRMQMEDIQGNIGGLTSGQEYTPEYDQSVMDNLDALLQTQEKRGVRNILDQQEERGMLRSGQSSERLVEEVLGPGLERRKQTALQLTGRRQEAQREERLGSLQFERQRQMQGEEMERQIAMVELQAIHQRRMLELRQMLENDSRPSFGRTFGQNFASSFGQGLGKSFGEAPGNAASGAMKAYTFGG